MKSLSDFFRKYKLIIKDDNDLKKRISGVFLDVCGVEIENDAIKLKNRTIFIKCSPIYKSQIFLKQKIIIEEINKITNLSFNKLQF